MDRAHLRLQLLLLLLLLAETMMMMLDAGCDAACQTAPAEPRRLSPSASQTCLNACSASVVSKYAQYISCYVVLEN